MKRLPSIITLFFVLLISLSLTGCANKPFLTPENTYAILTQSSDGKVQTTPIKLPWNTNQAVLQKLLVEASFVLSDLQTPTSQTPQDSGQTTYLQTTFPQSKKLLLNIDGLSLNMDVQSIQIEVQGSDVGRVILNQTWVLQGIPNPNLSPAYSDFLTMLQNQTNQAKKAAPTKQDTKTLQDNQTSQAGEAVEDKDINQINKLNQDGQDNQVNQSAKLAN